MANKLQIKRTTVSGRTPNTTSSSNTAFIDTGELAINLTDGKLFSSNGTSYFEVGANLDSVSVSSNNLFVNTTAVYLNSAVSANGSLGTSGQILTSNSTGVYWATPAVEESAIVYAIALG